MVLPMKNFKLSLAFIASLSVVLASGCSDDHVYSSLDEVTAASGGGTGNTGDLGDSTPTNRITRVYPVFDPAVPEVFDDTLSYTEQTVNITVRTADENSLVALNGQEVNFAAEWGVFLTADKDSCVLEDGSCTITWRSGDPATAPGSCFVAITVWTTGEEAFFDANDNGLFDVGEIHDDVEEPFLDINQSFAFEGAISTPEFIGELIDIINFDGTTPGSRNGVHDAGNGLYDGRLCAADNSAACSGRTSMIIHDTSFIQIQEPFTDSDDIDGDGDTSERLLICSFVNPF